MACAFDRGCRASTKRERKVNAAFHSPGLFKTYLNVKHRPLCLEKNEWKAEPPLGAFVQHSQLWCEQSGLGRKRSTSRRWCSLNGIWEGTRMFMKSRKPCVDPAAVGSANFRQRTACFSRSEDDAHQQSPEHWECTGNYRGRESSQCMRNAAKPPLTKPANARCVFFFFCLSW